MQSLQINVLQHVDSPDDGQASRFAQNELVRSLENRQLACCHAKSGHASVYASEVRVARYAAPSSAPSRSSALVSLAADQEQTVIFAVNGSHCIACSPTANWPGGDWHLAAGRPWAVCSPAVSCLAAGRAFLACTTESGLLAHSRLLLPSQLSEACGPHKVQLAACSRSSRA